MSPDLRERACADAPETASGPPAEAASRAVAPAPAAPAAPPPTAVRAEPPPPSMPAEPPPPIPPALPPRPLSTQTTAARVEWRLTVGTATVLALSALLIFGAGVAVGQLAVPSTAPLSAASLSSSQGRTTAPAPSPAVAAVRTHEVGPAPQPSAARPHAGKRLATPVRPISGAGYVFAGGRFQVSPDGRMVVRFTARTTCAGGVVLPSVEISQDGTFAFSGHPAGSSPGTTVRLTGRFGSPVEARATLHAARGTCHEAATPFVAHVS